MIIRILHTEEQPMRPSARTAVVLAAAGAVLAPLATGTALADPGSIDIVAVTGPTQVYDDAYAGTETEIYTVRQGNSTIVGLQVSGFPREAAGRTFGVHVHVNACGPRPEDAGPHYANPDAAPGTPLREKEIWLDVRIGRDGTGSSRADVPWRVAPGAAGSLVIHAERTDPATGDAGARLTCTFLPF